MLKASETWQFLNHDTTTSLKELLSGSDNSGFHRKRHLRGTLQNCSISKPSSVEMFNTSRIIQKNRKRPFFSSLSLQENGLSNIFNENISAKK